MIASTASKYGPPLHAAVLVHGDVGGVALVRGTEQRIVAGRDPHLDREEDRVAVGSNPLDHPPRRLGPVLPRHPVLHLGEAHAALVGEDPVAAIGRRAAGGKPGSESRERGNRPWHRLAGGGYRLQRPVLKDDVVEEGGRPAARARRPLAAVAFQDERRVSVRKGEELEMLVRVGALLEARRRPPRAGRGYRPGAG